MVKPQEIASQNINGIKDWFAVKKYHVIVWIIFIFYEAIVVGFITGKFGQISHYIIYYTQNIIIFYIHAHVILAKGLKQPKQIWWKLPLLVILEILFYLLVTLCLDYWVINYLNYTGTRRIGFNMAYIIAPIYRSIYFMSFATGYYFLLNFLKERRITEELDKQRLNNIIQLAKSENAILRAQINPHFLFNTLDFIYQNTRESSPVAAETIISLSEIMRYAIDSNSEKDFISMGEEINHVENLINLHQLRKNHSLQIRLNYEEDIQDIKFIPLVLITLVENIFKHGDLDHPELPAEINLYLNEGNLIIETSNQIKNRKNTSGLNTGIENVKKRLAYAYGDKATFKYAINNNVSFTVKIKVEIT